MNLTGLIHPLSVDAFFADYFERRPGLFRRGPELKAEEIFSRRDLDLYLSRDIPASEVRVVKTESTLDVAQITRPGSGFADAARLSQAYGEGYSISLHNIHGVNPTFNELQRSLAATFRARVEPNLYLTPPSAQGFRTHHDNQDVLVVQAFGSKRWTVFAAEIELPNRSFVYEQDPGTILIEETLQPGDVLYIPRGFAHFAATSGEASCHVTFTLGTKRWLDFVNYVVDRYSDVDPNLRRSLTPQLGPREILALQQAFAKLSHETALNACFEEFLRETAPPPRGPFSVS